MNGLHKDLNHNDGVHQPYDWVWADETARLAESVNGGQLYNKGVQVDGGNLTEWVLVDLTPTWVLVGGGVGSTPLLIPTSVTFTVTPNVSPNVSRCAMQMKDQFGNDWLGIQMVNYWVTSSSTDPSALSSTTDSYTDTIGTTIDLIGASLIVALAECVTSGLITIDVNGDVSDTTVYMWIALSSGLRFVSPAITYS